MTRPEKIDTAKNRLDRAVLRLVQSNAATDVLWERYDMALEAYRAAVTAAALASPRPSADEAGV